MKSWKMPTPEEVSRAVALVGRAANYRHFFERLENPLWIEPLWKKGFFKTPPKVESDESEKVIRFPRWPESRYLARMAILAPDDVAKVLEEIQDTDNLEVRQDILRAVLAMPAHLATKFVDEAKKWACERFVGDFLASQLGQLVSLLAKGGKADEAMTLAHDLLKIQTDHVQRGDDESLPALDVRPEPYGRFDTWEYEQILEKNIPHVVNVAGLDAITMLCDLLEGALHVKERRTVLKQHTDRSCMWRPAIEDHSQNYGHTVIDALISSLRDRVVRFCTKHPARIGPSVELLEKRQWPLFQRIGLHLLSQFSDEVPLLVETRITDEDLFDNVLVLHEYHQLCRVGFSHLSSEAQEKVLGWIKIGPERQTYAKWIRSGAKEQTERLIDEIIDDWRLNRLSPIRDHLTGEWAEYYSNLINKMGEPLHPDFSAWYESKTGFNSRWTRQQISAMSMKDLLSLMRTWASSTESVVTPSADGFGRALNVVVASRPSDFAAQAKEFIGLEPIFIRWLLYGLESAAQRGLEFDWEQILELCKWASEQPVSTPNRNKRYWDRDSDWGPTRCQIADLLCEGLSSGGSTIPFAQRRSVWRILVRLTSDPYPSVEVLSSSDDAWMQPYITSHNTTRGKALHAVILYALWVRENVKHARLLGDSEYQSFAIMPEVKSLLEVHLDIDNDPSPATRSVYGQWLPRLAWLDNEWLSSKLKTIFPCDETEDVYWRAAWDSYVVFRRYTRPVFQMLRSEYHRSIQSLAKDSDDYSLSDPDSGLVDHLMTGYWHGDECLEFENSLVKEFFEKAPYKLREHALHQIGRWLLNHPHELSQEVVRRLTSLWEWRRDTIKQSGEPEKFLREATQFGLWLASGKLDECWALEQLRFVIETSGKIEPAHCVLEHLAAVADQFPHAVADCLGEMVAKASEPRRIYGWREQAFETLRVVIESGNAEAVEKARKVANRFGELGFRKFRALVRPFGTKT